MSKIHIPDFWTVDQKKARLGEDMLDPLEKFVHAYTPAGIKDERQFYSDLQNVLRFVVKANAEK